MMLHSFPALPNSLSILCRPMISRKLKVNLQLQLLRFRITGLGIIGKWLEIGTSWLNMHLGSLIFPFIVNRLFPIIFRAPHLVTTNLICMPLHNILTGQIIYVILFHDSLSGFKIVTKYLHVTAPGATNNSVLDCNLNYFKDTLQWTRAEISACSIVVVFIRCSQSTVFYISKTSVDQATDW